MGRPRGLRPSQLVVPGTLLNRADEPSQLASLHAEEQWLYLELLPDCWAPHPVTESDPGYRAEKTNFSRLYPWPYSFSHYPELVTIGKDVTVDRLLNWISSPLHSTEPASLQMLPQVGGKFDWLIAHEDHEKERKERPTFLWTYVMQRMRTQLSPECTATEWLTQVALESLTESLRELGQRLSSSLQS